MFQADVAKPRPKDVVWSVEKFFENGEKRSVRGGTTTSWMSAKRKETGCAHCHTRAMMELEDFCIYALGVTGARDVRTLQKSYPSRDENKLRIRRGEESSKTSCRVRQDGVFGKGYCSKKGTLGEGGEGSDPSRVFVSSTAAISTVWGKRERRGFPYDETAALREEALFTREKEAAGICRISRGQGGGDGLLQRKDLADWGIGEKSFFQKRFPLREFTDVRSNLRQRRGGII